MTSLKIQSLTSQCLCCPSSLELKSFVIRAKSPNWLYFMYFFSFVLAFFILNGYLHVIDGKSIFGGEYLRTFTETTLPTDAGFPFSFTSRTNRMAVVSVTGDNLLSSTTPDYVWFSASYTLEMNPSNTAKRRK